MTRLNRRALMRNTATASAAVAAAALLAACGGGSPSPTSVPAAPVATATLVAAANQPAPASGNPSGSPVQITFNTVKKQDVSDWVDKGLTQDIDGWKAKGIDVKINAVPGDYPSYVAKVMALTSGGQLGDAIWYVARHQTNVGWGVRYNVVRDLGPLAKAANYDMNQFYPGSVSANSFQGKTYWICYIGEPVVPVIAYNKTKVQKLGLVEPQDGWTFDDLAAFAKSGTSSDTFGYYRADAGDALQGNVNYLRQWGVDITDELGQKSTLLNNKEGFVGALKLRYDLMQTWKASPSPANGQIDTSALFGGQKVLAVSVVPPSIQTYPATFKDFEIGFVTTPVLKKGDKLRSMLNQHTFGVTTTSKQPEAAFQFITWACGKEMVVQGLIQGQRATSARADVWADERVYQHFPNYRKLKPIMDAIEPDFKVGNFRGDEIDAAFAQAYDLLELGKTSPEQTATDAQKLCQDVLDKDPP